MIARKKSLGGTILILLVAGGLWLLRENNLLPAGLAEKATETAREIAAPDSGRGTAVARDTPRAPKRTSTAAPTTPKPDTGRDDAKKILDAYRAEQSDVMVEVGGVVTKTLPDDNDGSRHQRFIVRLSNGHTVLIAHNIDLAERVPLDEGDRVRIAGEFEYNDRGGVIHWTHHDPKGWRDGGWIEHDGTTYE